MTNLVAVPGWDNVPQIDTTTPLLGGPGGPLNLQAQALLDRTEYLKTLATTAAAITGGTIDGTTIGGTTPAPGHFTTISATGQISSTLATGTAPFSVVSTTPVANLSIGGNAATASNASQLLGTTWSAPGAIGGVTPSSGAFTTISATGQISSTLATGTAPFSIASTTLVPNLNVSQLLGGTWASPGTIGSTTPASGAFTSLSASGAVSGTGFSNYLASPPAIGGTAPAAGSFTTLSATGNATVAALIPSGATVPSNGLFLPAANTLGWAINGVQKMTLDSLGTLTATLNTATTAVTQAAGDNSTKVATTGFAAAGFVAKDSGTGAASLPVGTTAQRPANGAGKVRFNSDINRGEINNGTSWSGLGGATGGGSDDVFYENSKSVTGNYTITTGKNAMSTGPITVNAGVVVTVPAGSRWLIM